MARTEEVVTEVQLRTMEKAREERIAWSEIERQGTEQETKGAEAA